MSYYRINYGYLMNYPSEPNKIVNQSSSNNLNLNMNYSQNKPPSNFRPKKKLSEITKMNFGSENNFNNINNINNIISSGLITNPNRNRLNNHEIIKLDHKLIEATTEDRDHPLRELLKGLKGVGWFSSRFSQFPQEIYILFLNK